MTSLTAFLNFGANLAFRWHRAAKTSIFSAIPIGIAAFWPGFDRDPAFPIPAHCSIKNQHEKAWKIRKIAVQLSANFPAKNTGKRAKFICKKNRKICRKLTHFAVVFCILVWHISHCFLHTNLKHFVLYKSTGIASFTPGFDRDPACPIPAHSP